MKLNKKNGFSVQSLIVGSIIASIISTVAISISWDSISKGKSLTEKQRIERIKTNLKQDKFYNKSVFNINYKDDEIINLNNFKYMLFTISNKIDFSEKKDLGILLVLADYKNKNQVNRLKEVVEDFEKYNENVELSNETLNYNLTCSNDNDCFYSISNLTNFGNNFKLYSIEESIKLLNLKNGNSLLNLIDAKESDLIETEDKIYSYSLVKK